MHHAQRHPFAGQPRTRCRTDKRGNVTITISARALTPIRARARDVFSVAMSALLMIAAITLLWVQQSSNLTSWVVAVIGPWLAWPIFYWYFSLRLKRSQYIQLTNNQLRYRQFWCWKCFDRSLPHSFSLIPHDLTQWEAERQQYRQQRANQQRKTLRLRKYFGKSYHLSLDYLGQRNDIMVIFGQATAQRIQARLKAADEVMDSLAKQGRGTAVGPDAEWSDQPGNRIPD